MYNIILKKKFCKKKQANYIKNILTDADKQLFLRQSKAKLP